ncbi:OLC1v1006886C1 [Oldenlandia corymbosa var. corymbosa]|uniref:OLC1v1006886C1 n=1 Tax=Oldenlandia corymbosa var. corymbosa TaxID=529605 RepID=A0AAV1DKP2_OLDCO|nr:OLC1v1006886C1 [Oldenlandia corymbosa var. corymbosa]
MGLRRKNRRKKPPNRPTKPTSDPSPSGADAAVKTESDRFPSGPTAARVSNTILTKEADHPNNQSTPRRYFSGPFELTLAIRIPRQSGPRSMKPTAAPKDLPQREPIRREYPKGFTALAFVCKTGVLVATDHSYHRMDAETFVENVIDFTPHVLVTVSGTLHAKTFLRRMKDDYRLLQGSKGIKSVREVAKWVAWFSSQRNLKYFSAEFLVAGWDYETNRPRVFFVNKEARWAERIMGCTGCGSELIGVSCRLDQLSYDKASKESEMMLYMAVHQLADYRSYGDFTIECGGYLSGYCVGTNGLERVFHNVPLIEQVEKGEALKKLWELDDAIRS